MSNGGKVIVEMRKARAVFSLHVTAQAALEICQRTYVTVDGKQVDAPITQCQVVGFGTGRTREAGCDSLRIQSIDSKALPSVVGSYCGAVRVTNRGDGFLPCLVNIIAESLNSCEVVIMGVPDPSMSEFTCFVENEYRGFCGDVGSHVDLRILDRLKEPMLDCPGQWLRDRLLVLADDCTVKYSGGRPATKHGVLEFVEEAGLTPREYKGGENMPDGRTGATTRVHDLMDPLEMGLFEEEREHGQYVGGESGEGGSAPKLRPPHSKV